MGFHLQCLFNDLPSLPGIGTRWREQKQENNRRDIESR
jgi:hypothetical protein